jgi:tetratricopeptide (TPR) repeat protein
MENNDNTDIIEAYLNNELEAEERTAFENRIEKEPDLLEEIALHRKIRGFVKETEVNNLKSQVKGWMLEEKEEVTTKKIVLFSRTNLIRIAASFALISGLGWFYFNSQTSDNQYLTELVGQNPGTLQGGDDRNTWTQLFQEKKYAEVISIINKKEIRTSEEVYYLGLSYAAETNYSKAITQFSKTILQDSVYAEKANWALALVYLKQNNEDLAKPLLEKIADSDSEFSEKAKELLK